MASFYEILHLEEVISTCEEGLVVEQNVLEKLEATIASAEKDLAKCDKDVEGYKNNLRFLKKEAQVVMLSEYTDSALMLDGTRDTRQEIKVKIFEIQKKIDSQKSLIGVLETSMKAAQEALSHYRQLLEFKQP